MAERNPLRRTTDTVRSVAGTVLGILAVVAAVAAVLVGAAVQGDVAEQARRDAATSTPVTAELVESTLTVLNPSTGGIAQPWVPAEVRWTGPDGTQQRGRAQVEAGLEAGAAVPVWLDAAGRPTRAPFTGADAVLSGIVAGMTVAGLSGSALFLCWCGVRRATFAAAGRRWAQEWAAVEPQWRRELR